MATIILDECIACGACLPECPNEAIFEGEDIFFIEPDRCTECVGFHNEEACAASCPVDVCLPNPDIVETEAELLQKAKRLHPKHQFDKDYPSHFRE
jgi:ferredoxin